MIVALLYHDVVSGADYGSSGFDGPDANIYKLDRTEFQRHLDAVEASAGKSRVITLAARPLEPSPAGVALTFDDGGASAVWIADALEQRGWRGHFFLTTDYIDKPGFVTAAEIRDLDRRGHVIGSHSCSHPARMSHCDDSRLEREWRGSTEQLCDVLGKTCRVASVPGGYYSTRVAMAAAAAGVEVLFNSEPVTHVDHVNGCSVLGRFSIRQGVSAVTAGQIAAGRWSPRARQYVLWNSKKALKSTLGGLYIVTRKALIRRMSPPEQQ